MRRLLVAPAGLVQLVAPALLLVSLFPSPASTLDLASPDRPPKQFDLVLLHGLMNRQRWGEGFLSVCTESWGDGRVFLVYTNRSASERAVTSTVRVRGHLLVVGGRDLSSAGDESIARQAEHLDEIVARLQARRGLGPRFSIVAHSMGGLVARRYIADHPGVVTGLVTIGTPHHGSPLAYEGRWVGFFAQATEAIADLEPERCETFNERYPAGQARLAGGGRIYTIRGGVASSPSIAALGPLAIGWTLLHTAHGVESDGLVPQASGLLEGTVHLADFPALHHHALIRDPAVARRAAEALP